MTDDDARKIYAKLNSLEVMVRVALRSLSDLDPTNFEAIRSAAMDAGDRLRRPDGAPNPEFVDQGRLDTLALLAQSLEYVGTMEGVLKDQTKS